MDLDEVDEDELLALAYEESLRHYKEIELPMRDSDQPTSSTIDSDGSNFIGMKHRPTVRMRSSSTGLCEEEEAPGFDLANAGEWIYPTNYPVREYQKNIVASALFRNTLVCLPTGLGKTFIAAVVMYNYHRWYPGCKVVFMAHSKPLVAQQVDACCHVMGISHNIIAQLNGNMPHPKRQAHWQTKKIFFLTPQVFNNDLARRLVEPETIRCVVVDEAHKSLGNQAYCQVIKSLAPFNQRFRVLALSATPGDDLNSVKKVIQNLMISHLEVRSEEDPDIKRYLKEKKVEVIPVKLDEKIMQFKDRLLHVVEKYVTPLVKHKLMPQSYSTINSFVLITKQQNFIQDPSGPTDLRGMLVSNFSVAISLFKAMEELIVHGIRSFHSKLLKVKSGEGSTNKVHHRLAKDVDFDELITSLEDYLGHDKDVVFDPNVSLTHMLDRLDVLKLEDPPRQVVLSHPKFAALDQIVLSHFKACQDGQDGGQSKVIVFCKSRACTGEICNFLHRHRPLVKPMVFIGQSHAGSGAGSASKGFSQAEQLTVMRKFRAGVYNTLVATCVAEEGLDIGEVDLVINFDSGRNSNTQVQRCGRTGRKRAGRVVNLVTEGKEYHDYNVSISKGKSMKKKLVDNVQKLPMYSSNPRLLPKGSSPRCQEMYLTCTNNEPVSVTKTKKKQSKQKKVAPSEETMAVEEPAKDKPEPLSTQSTALNKYDIRYAMSKIEKKRETYSPNSSSGSLFESVGAKNRLYKNKKSKDNKRKEKEEEKNKKKTKKSTMMEVIDLGSSPGKEEHQVFCPAEVKEKEEAVVLDDVIKELGVTDEDAVRRWKKLEELLKTSGNSTVKTWECPEDVKEIFQLGLTVAANSNPFLELSRLRHCTLKEEDLSAITASDLEESEDDLVLKRNYIEEVKVDGFEEEANLTNFVMSLTPPSVGDLVCVRTSTPKVATSVMPSTSRAAVTELVTSTPKVGTSVMSSTSRGAVTELVTSIPKVGTSVMPSTSRGAVIELVTSIPEVGTSVMPSTSRGAVIELVTSIPEVGTSVMPSTSRGAVNNLSSNFKEETIKIPSFNKTIPRIADFGLWDDDDLFVAPLKSAAKDKSAVNINATLITVTQALNIVEDYQQADGEVKQPLADCESVLDAKQNTSIWEGRIDENDWRIETNKETRESMKTQNLVDGMGDLAGMCGILDNVEDVEIEPPLSPILIPSQATRRYSKLTAIHGAGNRTVTSPVLSRKKFRRHLQFPDSNKKMELLSTEQHSTDAVSCLIDGVRPLATQRAYQEDEDMFADVEREYQRRHEGNFKTEETVLGDRTEDEDDAFLQMWTKPKVKQGRMMSNRGAETEYKKDSVPLQMQPKKPDVRREMQELYKTNAVGHSRQEPSEIENEISKTRTSDGLFEARSKEIVSTERRADCDIQIQVGKKTEMESASQEGKDKKRAPKTAIVRPFHIQEQRTDVFLRETVGNQVKPDTHQPELVTCSGWVKTKPALNVVAADSSGCASKKLKTQNDPDLGSSTKIKSKAISAWKGKSEEQTTREVARSSMGIASFDLLPDILGELEPEESFIGRRKPAKPLVDESCMMEDDGHLSDGTLEAIRAVEEFERKHTAGDVDDELDAESLEALRAVEEFERENRQRTDNTNAGGDHMLQEETWVTAGRKKQKELWMTAGRKEQKKTSVTADIWGSDESDDFFQPTKVLSQVKNPRKTRKTHVYHKSNKFMETEADLSGRDGEVSSDEENTSGLDEYDSSFVDEREVLTQAPDVDMTAKYLQSTKSPLGRRPNAFKIPHMRSSCVSPSDILSQIEPAADDSYHNDSFCVDDESDNDKREMSALELAELILESRKRKKKRRRDDEEGQRECKGKGKKRKLKRILRIASESSEEEVAASGVGCPGDQSKHTMTAEVYRNSIQNTSLSDAVLHKNPVKNISLSDAVVHKNPVKNISLSDAVVHKNPVKNISLSDAVVHKNPVKSILLSDAIVHRNPVKNTSLSDAQMSGNIDVLPLGTNTSKALPQRKMATEPVVFIASRQIASAPDITTFLRSKWKAQIHVRSLPGADFIVSSRIGINRITLSDFSNGSPATRTSLKESVHSLRSRFSHPVVIVEDDKRKGLPLTVGCHKTMWSKHCLDTLAKFSQAGVKTLFSRDREDTARLIASLANEEAGRGRAINLRLSNLSPQLEARLNMYSCLPGLNIGHAVEICSKFHSVSSFLNCCDSAESLQAQLQVDKETAIRVFQSLSNVPFT